MKKTFEELVELKHNNIVGETSYYTPFLDDVQIVELMQQVRVATLQECADNNETDITWLRQDLMELKPGEDYEVYVINSSILDLDKDSIEL